MTPSTKVITMHDAKTLKHGFGSLLFVLAIAVSGSVMAVCAQEKSKSQPAAKRVATDAGRDPFRRYEPPRITTKLSGEVVLVPTIQERIQQYRAQKMAAMNAHVPAPKPTTALLLSELQVVGITRTPRGYAAIVEATPIKLSYVIYPGERFYDGQLVAIEDTRLVFRHETVMRDGRRERSVEMKSLRQPNAADAMTAVKTAPANAPVAASDKKSEEKVPATEKP
jgi:hypothetical protein